MAGSKFKEAIDRLFLGNRGYDYQSGQWDRQGVKQGLIQGGVGAVNPLAGLLTRMYFNYQNKSPNYEVERGQFPLYMSGVQVGNAAQPSQPMQPQQGQWQGFGDPFANPIGGPQGFGAFTPQAGIAPRAIGGTLNFSGGAGGYNNGVGAGTGFGASNIQNDSWGQAAAGFGIGATNGSDSISRDDAMRQNMMNRV